MACPVCLTHWDGTPPTERQIVRTYHVKQQGMGYTRAETLFQQEAALMSKAGWRISSQAQVGTDKVFGAPFPRLSVVYERG